MNQKAMDETSEYSKKKKRAEKKEWDEEDFSDEEMDSWEEIEDSDEKVKDVDELINGDREEKKKKTEEVLKKDKNWNPDEIKSEKKDKTTGWFWKVFSGILIILLLISIYTNGFDFNSNKSATLSKSAAEKKVVDYINKNLLQAPYVAKVTSSKEVSNVFMITIDVAGQSIDSYVTKDGTLFFPQGLDITKPLNLTTDTELDSATNSIVNVSIGNAVIKGSVNAPVTIIEFSEYQCPYCKKYVDETYSSIIKNYVDTGKVKYYFRNFPLSFHSEAKPAAMAAECAKEQGKFWEYHDLLFKNQVNLSASNYKSWAKELGLDTAKFDSCVDTEKYKTLIENDLSEGQDYGVSGTPAFFINGKLISGAQPYAVFQQVIDLELKNVQNSTVNNPTTEKKMVNTTSSSNSTKLSEFSITAKKWRFDPKDITVNKGDKVKLMITSQDAEHSFELAEYQISKIIPANSNISIEFTANINGTFNFKSKSNSAMIGTLTVK